jgi:hypothetical protein
LKSFSTSSDLPQRPYVSVPEQSRPRRYVRPYVLPESLEPLTGPVGGVVRLPRHLAWSVGASPTVSFFHRCGEYCIAVKHALPNSCPPTMSPLG